MNGAVGAIHLTYAAADAFMPALFIIFEGKFGAETVCYVKCGTVFGIALCNLFGYKLFTRNFHTLDKAFQALTNSLEIFFYTTHDVDYTLTLFVNLATQNVEQFCGDALLTQLIVFKLQFLLQFLGIIIGCLHGHDAGCLFGGSVLNGYFLHQRQHEHGQNLAENAVGVRFKDVYDV